MSEVTGPKPTNVYPVELKKGEVGALITFHFKEAARYKRAYDRNGKYGALEEHHNHLDRIKYFMRVKKTE